MAKSTKQRGFDPIAGQYITLDTQAWLKEHQVEKRGREQGQQNQPSAESQELDATESRIKAWIHERAKTTREDVSNYLNDLELRLASMESPEDLLALGQKIEEIRNDAELDFRAMREKTRSEVSRKRMKWDEQCKALEDFKGQAGLNRPADYSQRKSAWKWLVGFGLFEIFLNATLLMEVNAFGLLGSIAQMTFISLLNVGAFALVIATLIRYTNHCEKHSRIFASTGLGVTLIGTLAFNLLVGHFRDSMQAIVHDYDADITLVGADTVDRLLSGPFDLGSFQSLLLVIVGVVCCGIATWKWWQRDDAYPRYGHQARQVEASEESYLSARDSAMESIPSGMKRHLDRLHDLRHKVEISRGHWKETCSKGRHLIDEYARHMRQYQLDLEFLISTYRTANKNARTSPAPARFESGVPLESGLYEPIAFSPPPETKVDTVFEQVHEAIDHLQRALRQSMENLESTDVAK